MSFLMYLCHCRYINCGDFLRKCLKPSYYVFGKVLTLDTTVFSTPHTSSQSLLLLNSISVLEKI